jgi:hypothetical protein
MLPDRLTELVTAYIDGELSARQRRAVLRLLERSPEARQLLQELRDDALRLRGLPRAHLSRHFPQRVVRAVSDRPITLPLRPAARPRPAFPTWLGIATAASVLVLVSVASYVYFATTEGPRTPAGFVQNGDAGKPDVPKDGSRDQEPVPPVGKGATPESAPGPSLVVWGLERIGRWGTEELERLARADDKKPAGNSDLATPSRKPGAFDVVSPSGLLLLKVRELDQEKPGRQLRDELARDSACRIELFCRENPKGFARLQAAFQKHGIRLLIDKDAQTCLSRRAKTSYVLYAEDLTAGELATILQEVGREDRQAEARREAQFDRVIVNALSQADYKELSDLLGIDIKRLQAPPKMDPRRPISEKTADDVIRVLEGQGPQRPVAGKPAVKGPDRVALVLASRLLRPRSASTEIKLFVDGRKERRPGTMQLVLVLHENHG